MDFKEPYTVYELVNLDGEPKKAIDCVVADDNYDLTFSDYDQWTGWVDYHKTDTITEDDLEKGREVLRNNSIYHAEDDECETCNDRGYIFSDRSANISGKEPHIKDCPDCKDDTEERSYSQRKPHRQEQDPIPDSQFDNSPDSEEWDEKKKVQLADEIYNAITSWKPRIAQESAEELTHEIIDNLDYIDQLESELEDVKEERGKMSDKLTKINNILDNQK